MSGIEPLVDCPVVNTKLIALLRQDLLAAKWTVDTVESLMGPIASAALNRDQRVPAMQKLAEEHTPQAVLTKLFILAEPVGSLALARTFAKLGVEGITELGLVGADDKKTYVAKVDFRPHCAQLPGGFTQNWWIASDLSEAQTGQSLHPEHVLGIGSATLSLLRMTVREPVDAALDLGTGCGIQALYLATHAQKVVATDLSRRACEFARFNAAVNLVANVEVRCGSLFDPVRGERFNQITSNPPFVITPQKVRENALMEYRDGGMDRDTLIAKIIMDAPNFLQKDGLLQMLANWEIHSQDDLLPKDNWFKRVEKWLQIAAQSCQPEQLQAWVVQRDILDYCRYAEMWMRDSGGQLTGREQWESDYREWVSDFQGAQVEEIGMGFLAMRRSSKSQGSGSLVSLAQYLPEGTFPDGQTVKSTLDYLRLPSDWRERKVVRATDVREERHYLPGSQDPQLIRLTQGGGMGRAQQVSSSGAALVGVADGELTIGQVIEALAALTQVDANEIEAQVKTELPAMLQSGILTMS